jgi:hypothetical protein
MKYIKKPVAVEAVQFNGASTHAAHILRWVTGGEAPKEGLIHTRDIVNFEICTLEGVMTVRPGDFVIKGVKGEFYPCKPDIFKETYYTEQEYAELNQ